MIINTVSLDDTLDIKGRNAESKSPTEGSVTFNIIFDAFVPMNGKKELEKMGGLMEPLLDIAIEQTTERVTEQVTAKVTAETEKNTLLKT